VHVYARLTAIFTMGLMKRIIASDEELGKRDDEYRPPGSSSLRPAGLWRGIGRTPSRWRKKRILYTIGIAVMLWVFLDRVPRWSAYQMRGMSMFEHSLGQDDEPTGPPPREAKEDPKVEKDHYYEGLIKFYRLSASLHQLGSISGYQETNRNILFAVASLKSASMLIPMACEMAKWNRNHVHMAIMGREDLPMAEIQEINGAADSCKVWWHDARPDYTEFSTDMRAEASVSAAMRHFYQFMHPQVVIVDESLDEEPWHIRAIHSQAKQSGYSVIGIPTRATERLMWIAHLDSGSLKSWHKPSIDIIVHAPPQGSGSLIRLLRSLQEADYTGLAVPHITVELPSHVDPPTEVFLQNMQWPPSSYVRPGQPKSQLNVRRRVLDRHIGPAESSGRFIESFFPSDDNHILVLSPQAELSPSYFHYLRYILLEYKYSSWGVSDYYRTRLAGISLDSPASYLNGTIPFHYPDFRDVDPTGYSKKQAEMEIPFMWEAPNSNAALYFADKWRELHSFIACRLKAENVVLHVEARKKLISSKFPAWTEFFLELMRARGYNLLYPVRSTAKAIVTVHTDLYQSPAEFADPEAQSEERDTKPAPATDKEPFLPPTTPAQALSAINDPSPSFSYLPIHQILPFEADLPDLPNIPYLSYSGVSLDHSTLQAHHHPFRDAFRHKVGGCAADVDDESRQVVAGSAKDLFCLESEDEQKLANEKPLDFDIVDELVNWRDPTAMENKEKAKQAVPSEVTSDAASQARDADYIDLAVTSVTRSQR
jgi:hypothetical protein